MEMPLGPVPQLDELPMELVLMICKYLTKKELRRLNLTCRSLYSKTLASLYQGETASSSLRSVFGWASAQGSPGTVDVLVQFGFDVNKPEEPTGPWDLRTLTPLERAVRDFQKDIVERLALSGADVNSTAGCTTPLLEAMGLSQSHPLQASQQYSLVQTLLDLGSDPDLGATGVWLATPLSVAVSARNIELIQLLLHYGAEVNPVEDRLLYRAICFHDSSPRDKEIISLLLEQGADPNAMGRIEGCKKHPTPLARAVYECHTWIEPGTPGAEERYPLKVVDMLLDHGADINYVSVTDRENIIHRAIHPRQKLQVLRHLLSRGADPNIANMSLAKRYGLWTPLHKAMWKKVPADRVELLLDYGATPLPQLAGPKVSDASDSSAQQDEAGTKDKIDKAPSHHPSALSPIHPPPTPHRLFYPLNTHNHPTPLRQLLANHISPITGLALPGWRISRDWAKFRLLLGSAAHPSEVLSASLTRNELSMLFSLSIGGPCRNEKQMRRHLGGFGKLTGMSMKEVLELSGEEGFAGIWDWGGWEEMERAPGAVGVGLGPGGGLVGRDYDASQFGGALDLNGRWGGKSGKGAEGNWTRDQMFYGRGLTRVTKAREMLREICGVRRGWSGL